MAIRAKSLGAVLGAACALALGVSGTANAASFTWQDYTRDSTWNCGPAGSTVQVGNLYVLPCIKISYGDWQPVLMVTALSSGGNIVDYQTALAFNSGGSSPLSSADCTDQNGDANAYIPPHTTLACFSPTKYTPNTLVEGEFGVEVGSTYKDLYSPGAWTTS